MFNQCPGSNTWAHLNASNMATITNMLGNIGTGLSIANGVGNLVDGLFGSDGVFGHSSWYKTLKNGEAQNQVNQQMAQWNMENVTKPVFQMENKEWQRRFGEQNTEWERQWNLQNEYNSPEEQLKRYMAIGGNPADFVQGGNGAATPSAPGQIGSPSVNEAASSFANPANLAQLQSNEIERKAKNAYAFNMNMQAIKQSIDNITEADFRSRELEAMGINIKLGKSNIGKTEAERTQILYDMFGLSAKGQNLMASTKNLLQSINESVQRTKVLEEEQKLRHEQMLNAQTEGDILMLEKEWMPFEKFFELSETKSRFIMNMQKAGADAATARYMYESINTEIKKQQYIGLQSTGQEFSNRIIWYDAQMKGDYYKKVFPQSISFQGEKLSVDTDLYGKNAKWDLINRAASNTIDRAAQWVGLGIQGLNTAVDAWAVSQSKGMSKAMQPNITIGTPGYNTSPVYQGGNYSPYGQ